MFVDPVQIPVQVPSADELFSEPADKNYSVIPEPTAQNQGADPYMLAAAQENGMNIPGANVSNMSMEDLLKYGQFYSDLHGNRYDAGVLTDTLDVAGSVAGGAVSLLGGLYSGYQGLRGNHADAAEASAGVSDFVGNILHSDSYAARQRALAAQMALKQEESKRQYQRDVANGRSPVIATLGLIGRGIADELATKSGFEHLNTVASAVGSLAPAAITAAATGAGAVVAGAGAVTAAEAGSIYGQAAAEAAQAINNMSTADLYERSPEFGNHVARYLEAGYPQNIAESRARVDIFEEAASQAGSMSVPAALTTFVPYAGKIAKNILPKAVETVASTSAKKTLGHLAAGGLAEGVEEAAQESMGTIASNVAIEQNIDKDKAYFETVGEAMASGFIGGLGSRMSLDTLPAARIAYNSVQEEVKKASTKPEGTPPGSPEPPKTPDTPKTSDTPKASDIPKTSEPPKTPDTPEPPNAPEPPSNSDPETSEPGKYASVADDVNAADAAGSPDTPVNSTGPVSNVTDQAAKDQEIKGKNTSYLNDILESSSSLFKEKAFKPEDLSMLKEAVDSGEYKAVSEADDRVIRAIREYTDFSKQFTDGIKTVSSEAVSGDILNRDLSGTRESINSLYAGFINGIRDQRPGPVVSSIGGFLRLAQIRANKAEALLESYSNGGEKVKYRTYQSRAPHKAYAAEISANSSELATAISLELDVAIKAASKVINNIDVSRLDIDISNFRQQLKKLKASAHRLKTSKSYSDMLNELSERAEARNAAVPPGVSVPQEQEPAVSSGSFIPEVSRPAAPVRPSIPEKSPEPVENTQEAQPADTVPPEVHEPEEPQKTQPAQEPEENTSNKTEAQPEKIPEPAVEVKPAEEDSPGSRTSEPEEPVKQEAAEPVKQEPQTVEPVKQEPQITEPDKPEVQETEPVKQETKTTEPVKQEASKPVEQTTDEPVKQQEDTPVSVKSEPEEEEESAPEQRAESVQNKDVEEAPQNVTQKPEPQESITEPAPEVNTINPDTDADPDTAAAAPDEESDAVISHAAEGEVHEEPEAAETNEEIQEAERTRKYRFHWSDATNTAIDENASKELLLDKSLAGEDFERSAQRLRTILTENFGEGVNSVRIYASAMSDDSGKYGKIQKLSDTSGLVRLLKRSGITPEPDKAPEAGSWIDPSKADEITHSKMEDLIHNLGITRDDDISTLRNINNEIIERFKSDLGTRFPVVDSPVILIDESKPLNEIFLRAHRFGSTSRSDLREFILKEYLKGRGYHILNANKINKINSDNPESLIQLLDYLPRKNELAGVNFVNQSAIKPEAILNYLEDTEDTNFFPDISELDTQDYIEFKDKGLTSINMEYSLPASITDPAERLNTMARVNRAILFNVSRTREASPLSLVLEHARKDTGELIRDTANALKEFANEHMANSKFTVMYTDSALGNSKAMSRYQQTGSAVYFDYFNDVESKVRASLNPDVADAASISVLHMLQSAAALRHVSSKATFDDLASVYQVTKADIRELSEDDLEVLKTGISLEAFSKKFADTFLDVLGVTSNRSVSESADGDRTARALGLIVSHFLQNQEWAEIHRISVSDTKKINIIRILKPEPDEETGKAEDPAYKFDVADKNTIPKTLSLASFRNRIDYYHDDVMPDISLIRKSGGLPMSAEEKASVLKDRQVKYHFNATVYNIFNTLNAEGILKYKGSLYIPDKAATEAFGKVMNQNSLLSEKGKTDGISRALTINRERASIISGKDPDQRYIRFDSYIGVNGRLVQRGNGSTPLSTKMDRAVLNNVQEELDPRNPEHMRQFYKAIFQTLGGKVHKNSDEKIKKAVEKVAQLVKKSKLRVSSKINDVIDRDGLIASLDTLEAGVKKLGLGNGNFELRMLVYATLLNYNQAMKGEPGTKFTNNVYIEYDGSSDGTHNAQIISSPKTGGSLATMSRTGLEFSTEESKREKFSDPDVRDAYETSLEKSKEIANERIRGDKTGNTARFAQAFSKLTHDKFIKINKENGQLEKFERDAGKVQATAINYGQGEKSNRDYTQDLLLQQEFDTLCNAMLATLPQKYADGFPFKVDEFIRTNGSPETVEIFNSWNDFFTAMEAMAGRQEVEGFNNRSIFRNNVNVTSQEQLDNVRSFIKYASMFQMTAQHMNLSYSPEEPEAAHIVYTPSAYSEKIPRNFMREYQIRNIWGKTFDYIISDPVYQGNRASLGDGYIHFINKVTAVSASIDLLAREREIQAYSDAGSSSGTLPSRKAMDRFRKEEKFNRNINSNLHSSTGSTISNSRQKQLTSGEHTPLKDFKIEMPARIDENGRTVPLDAGSSISTRRSAVSPGLTLVSPNTTIAYGDAFMQNNFASQVENILRDPTEAGIDDVTVDTLEQAANRYDGVESPTLGSEKIGEMLCESDLMKMKLNPYNTLAYNLDALLYNEETASYLAKQFNSNPSFAYNLTEAINSYYLNDSEMGGGQFSISSGEEAVSYLKQMAVDFSSDVATITRQNLAIAQTMEFTSTHVAIDDVKYVHKPDHPKIVELNSIYNLALENMGDMDQGTLNDFHAREIERRAMLVDPEGNLIKEEVDSYIQEMRETYASLLENSPVPESEWPPEPEVTEASSSGSTAQSPRKKSPTLSDIIKEIPEEYSPEIFGENGFLKNVDKSVANFIRNGLFDNVKIEVMYQNAMAVQYGGIDGFIGNAKKVLGFFANNQRKIVINRAKLRGKNKTQIGRIIAHELIHAAGNSIIRLGADMDITKEDIARMAQSLDIPLEEMNKRIASYRNGVEVLKNTALAVDKFLGSDTVDAEGNVSNDIIEKYIAEYSGRMPAEEMRNVLYYLHRNIRALRKAVDNKRDIFIPLAEIMALSVQAGITSDFMDHIKLNSKDHSRVFQGLTKFLNTLYRAAADLITRAITGVTRGADTLSARDIIRDIVNVLADKRMQEAVVNSTSYLYKRGEQYSNLESGTEAPDMLNDALTSNIKSSSRLFSEPEELDRFDEAFTAYVGTSKGGTTLSEIQNILTGIYESLSGSDMLTAEERQSLTEPERNILTEHRQDILDLGGKYRYPVLLALSASSKKFREIIDAIPADRLSRRIKDVSVIRSGKKDFDNKINNFVEQKTAEFLERITSKKLKGAPASGQLDYLRNRLRRAALEKEKADIAGKALGKAENFARKTLSKAGEFAVKKSRVASAVATILGENTFARDAFLKWSTRPNLPGPVRGLFNFSVRELFTADTSYSQIQKMEKKARADIQSVRTSFREIVPQKIEEELLSYGYELTPERSEALTRTVLALDLGCLDNKGIIDAVNRSQEYLGNLGYSPVPGVSNRDLKIFADDLAHKLATGMYGKSGGTHYRSAEALLRGLAGYNRYSKEVANKLNSEITLKALSLVPESQFNLLRELTQNQKAFNYVISQQRSMQSSDLENAEFKFNTIKGYYPKSQTNTVNVITVHRPEDIELYKSIGYKVTGTDKSDFTGRKYTYMASPYNPVSAFTQGALQTAVNRSGGISNYTGISSEPILETFTGKANLIKLGKRNMETMQDHVPVYSRTGWLVGYEVVPDLNQYAGKEYEPSFAKNVGFWAGRIFEQKRVDDFNEDIVYALKRQWEKATRAEKETFVNLSKSKDRVIKDAMNSLSPKVRADIREFFPDGLMVRKDMIEDVIGYRDASIVDILTGNISWLSPQNADKLGGALRSMFGNKLISYAVKGERLAKSASSTVRNIIVIRSGMVMAVNALSNLIQLSTLGVSPKEILKNVPSMVRQLEHYQVYQRRKIALTAKINGLSYSSDEAERLRLTREYSAIEEGTRKSVPDVIDLIDSGEMSTIADLGEVNDDLLPSMGKWGEYLEDVYNSLPEAVQTAGRYAVVSKGTALYRFLEKGTQYGDFIAKAVYYKHLVEVKGMPKEKAQDLVRYMFVNYDMLAGRSRAYLENIGLLWFYNYKLRAVRSAMYMLRHNPLKALLYSTMPGTSEVGTALSDNLVSKILSGGWLNSVGPGTLLSGPSQNLWANIFI